MPELSSSISDKITYNHIALNVDDQLALLVEKGLIINNRERAKELLSHISYFRFKNYSYQFKKYTDTESRYNEGTLFEDVINLYHFDRDLKALLFENIQSIEVSIKTQISNIMSCSYGPHWYLDPNMFLSEEDVRKLRRETKTGENTPKVFQHDLFLKDLEEECNEPDEIFLQHYAKTYTPKHPPSWMVMEIITFGTLSLMFENLHPSEEKKSICENYQLTKAQLVSWLHSFSYIRNKCVHHSKIVYKAVKFAPKMPVKQSRIFLNDNHLVRQNSLYAVMCCMQKILSVSNLSSSFSSKLKSLIIKYPNIDLDLIGFTENWENEEIWSD